MTPLGDRFGRSRRRWKQVLLDDDDASKIERNQRVDETCGLFSVGRGLNEDAGFYGPGERQFITTNDPSSLL